MSYAIEVTLKKVGFNTWVILAPKGHVLVQLRAGSLAEAEREASAYMSSWSSVCIKVEDSDVVTN